MDRARQPWTETSNSSRIHQSRPRNILSQYKDETEQWKLVSDVRHAIKKQLLEAVEDEYLEDLKDPDTGYANITPLEMIEHLYTDYGKMTEQDISNIKASIKIEYDTNTTMTSYFSNLRNIRTIADRAANPISDSDMLAKIYLVMGRTGIYEKGLDDWNKLPTALKTWAQFQLHFKAAYKRNKEKMARQAASNPTRGQPHAMANNAMETLASTMERHLDNYANATTGDRDSLANLVTSNATLVATNSELTAKMETCLVEITKL